MGTREVGVLHAGPALAQEDHGLGQFGPVYLQGGRAGSGPGRATPSGPHRGLLRFPEAGLLLSTRMLSIKRCVGRVLLTGEKQIGLDFSGIILLLPGR